MKRMSTIVAVFVFCFSIFSICLLSNEKYTVANATTNYYDVSKYVDSDFLLRNDGTLSDKTVQDFSKEVKNALFGTCFDELDEVIPAQYLNTTEENAVFQYNGKEYGFYVAKEGDRFDVLLIDFAYDFIEQGRPKRYG